MDMRILVGTNFARLRKERGLTQEQIEERSGFSQWYISSLERGRRNPTVITLYELANALDVRVIDLLLEASPVGGVVQLPPIEGPARTVRKRLKDGGRS